VRRGFIKAEESVPTAARSPELLATRFKALIGRLFAAEAHNAKWKPERRQRLRTRHSSDVLAILKRMLVENQWNSDVSNARRQSSGAGPNAQSKVGERPSRH
jgi:hypothetical protein